MAPLRPQHPRKVVTVTNFRPPLPFRLLFPAALLRLPSLTIYFQDFLARLMQPEMFGTLVRMG